MTELAYPAVELRTSPHIRSADDTKAIMQRVVLSLLPVCAFSIYAFGPSAALLLIVCTASCVLTEHFYCRLLKRANTVGDWSAVITGLLLALTLPPGFPLWMAVIGGFVAIALGKLLFGGLGYNPFNPALVGRAFLQAAFPVAITTWTPAFGAGRLFSAIPSTLAWPFLKPAPISEYVDGLAVDGFSGATPLSLMKFDFGTPAYEAITGLDLFYGRVAGSVGETSALLILLGGIYLLATRTMRWRIPVAVLASVAVFSAAFWVYDRGQYPSPLFMLFSGGLMLGAVYMATDMVTSPTTPLGEWTFGILIGLITVVIRLKGGLPEGVMYAILLANAVTPIINSLTQPRVYGAAKARRKA